MTEQSTARPATATRWAWQQLAARSRTAAPLKLTLLAACDLLDQASDRAGRSMFHHDVLDLTVTGFKAADLAAAVGVTAATLTRYCDLLVAVGLLDHASRRRFSLPREAWQSATDPTERPAPDRSPSARPDTTAAPC